MADPEGPDESTEKKPTLNPYQKAFLEELKQAAVDYPDTITRVIRRRHVTGYAIAEVELNTADMQQVDSGMQVGERESVFVAIGEHDLLPPRVYVAHGRFAGYPHILTENELCIYLDPTREWDPAAGAEGFLDRLYRWFEDAAANRFNPETALYHPVGGRAHWADDTRLIVCRDDLDIDKPLGFAWLVTKGPRRIDLCTSDPGTGEREHILVVRTTEPLHAGPGTTVRALQTVLGTTLGQQAIEAWKQRIKRRHQDGHTDVHIALAVPRPTPGTHYLLVGHIDLSPSLEGGELHDLGITWCSMSDERPSISTRRDVDRPVNAYHKVDVALLGCGGLGSWIAEFIARAGAASIELVDYGQVTGGLLVRQNYTEADIAESKVDALAERLRSIAPECAVTTSVTAGLTSRTAELLCQDGAIVIDATISRAVGRQFDNIAAHSERRALIAQVATDVGTGSLGMTVISSPADARGPLMIDTAAGVEVAQDGHLEPYATFWTPMEEDELIPAKGCSLPTFHGSAADLAAVAAQHVNLIAQHMGTNVSGVHLFALPHTGITPQHRFVPVSCLSTG
ncbi:ThiF family adenylyltransferase [Nocardiopsis dassonvillei]|uniref:ThiF family adenylyltransferase n=1 Tax=Nocardiopsis dassonvillei TaxID=2014 RepID=UPI0008FC5424|nr:ThiF family adenylyltransferase [Nocardiopsis dassonvillei]